MKRMRSSFTWRAVSGLLAMGALVALTPASALDAQDVRVRQECKCVDRDGNEIERCSCVRLPDVEGMVARVMNIGSRARIGITLAGDQGDAESLGARVESVMEGGPADEAGIREGDIITRLDGHDLLAHVEGDVERHFDLDRSMPVQRLMAVARELEPGQEVEVEFLRDGTRQTVTLEARELSELGNVFVAPGFDVEVMSDRMRDLGERMREFRFEAPEGGARVHVWADSADAPHVRLRTLPGGGAYAFSEGGDWTVRRWECPGDEGPGRTFVAFGSECIGGLELVDLKPGLAEYFGTAEGVLVSDVHEDSTLGLQPGDVVLSVDGRETTSPDQLRRILRSYDAEEEVSMRAVDLPFVLGPAGPALPPGVV